ncbi:DUF2326 domain-containing protein [Microvirga sp. 2MCAF35]|uniref:DUF2326 domain-containing protein n=1 Tax=Microvirga sp. 2MCAF35 TaxID=3232987 RepID=UPI003F956392
MKAERIDAERSLQTDLSERKGIVEESISLFQEISSRIYEVPAEFDIASGPNGPVFTIKQPARMADGINQMQIFTFDLMLASMSAARGAWPGFLIHDSAIFDPVDPRQIGAALVIGHEKMMSLGGQYIVTLNSDQLEKAQSEAQVDLMQYVLEPVLTDRPGGGLFGFEFQHDIDAVPQTRSDG